jgi:hypothetical protein
MNKKISTVEINGVEITFIEEKFADTYAKFYFNGKEHVVSGFNRRNVLFQIQTILLERN